MMTVITEKKHTTITITKQYTGTAKVKWIPENRWSVGHYEAFICVPFKDTFWESLFVYDKENLDEAVEKAAKWLDYHLEHCTHIV